MKITKVLLSSFVLAGMLSACANEEMLEVVNNDATLNERTQVNLTFSSPAMTRMSAGTDGKTPSWEAHDYLGAVIVDNGKGAGWQGVDWDVTEGHIGNNKWAWNGAKFSTEGTTSVGAWMFYSPFQEAMTTSRDGVKFAFPQIQEGATDLSWTENSNVNFKITPVLKIDGYEGQEYVLPMIYSSVYNYLNLKLKFKEADKVTAVNKILVYAEDYNGNPVHFPAEYKVINANVPVANLSLSEEPGAPKVSKNWDKDLAGDIEAIDQNYEIRNAWFTLRERGKVWDDLDGDKLVDDGSIDLVDWNNNDMSTTRTVTKPLLAQEGVKTYDYLVVDCDATHENVAGAGMPVDGIFNTWMLMPAGAYESITLVIYTDKGIYERIVKTRDSWMENDAAEAGTTAVDQHILLRSGLAQSLSNVERFKEKDNAVYDYLYVEDKYSGNQIITKTADLIYFVNGISVKGEYNVYVTTQPEIGKDGIEESLPGHSVVINDKVMAALTAKETALAGEVHLNFVDANVEIVGTETGHLELHNMSFPKGATISSGRVRILEDVLFEGAEASVLVKEGAFLNVHLLKAQNAIKKVTVEEGAQMTVTKNSLAEVPVTAAIIEVDNYGTFITGKNANLFASEIENYGGKINLRAGAVVEVGALRNGVSPEYNAELTNGGTLTILNSASNKSSVLTNDGTINIKGTFTNDNSSTPGWNPAQIVNKHELFVNSDASGLLTIEAATSVVNHGRINTGLGDNKIYNYGTIETKEGSTTYITRNSKLDEKTTGTTANNQEMGTIKLAARNTDISVTDANFQGYKEYSVTSADLNEGVLAAAFGDKFNKVVFAQNAEISADLNTKVRFVITSKDIKLNAGARIQEMTFTANASLYAEPQTSPASKPVVAQLTVNENVLLKVPTENAIYVFDINGLTTSKTSVKIINKGEILVGGNLYTSVTEGTAKSSSTYTAADGSTKVGIFSSGNAGQAFNWGSTL